MTTHTIRKGFDIRLAGRAADTVSDAPDPLLVALEPGEFRGIKPKLLVAEGDAVQTGQPLFFDKVAPATRFVAPATGKVTKIVRGARRFPERIEITPAEQDSFAEIPAVDADKLGQIGRDELIAAIQGSGLWPMIRQRPLGVTARPATVPSAIYVNGMDSEPLAADPAVALAGGRGAHLQLGIDLLKRLTDGPVHLTVRAGANLPAELSGLQGVERHDFAGPHPAGLVGTHIARIAPLKPEQTVWYLKAQEAALLGEWVATRRWPTHRVVAVAGNGAPSKQYYKVRSGAALMTLTGGKPLTGDLRLISGTVLSGVAAEPQGFLGYYAHTLTIIPDGGGRRDLFGWALPQFGKLSASRSVFGWLFPKKDYDLDARLNGGVRNIVNIGAWESVTPLDIHPTFLVRAIQAGDLDEALSLGLLELTEEDVALCTYADPCKIEVGEIIRQGLDLYEKEG